MGITVRAVNEFDAHPLTLTTGVDFVFWSCGCGARGKAASINEATAGYAEHKLLAVEAAEDAGVS